MQFLVGFFFSFSQLRFTASCYDNSLNQLNEFGEIEKAGEGENGKEGRDAGDGEEEQRKLSPLLVRNFRFRL